MIGYDLVGEEDAGNSHLFYIAPLTELYDPDTQQSSLPLYMHTAETNWAEDLVRKRLRRWTRDLGPLGSIHAPCCSIDGQIYNLVVVVQKRIIKLKRLIFSFIVICIYIGFFCVCLTTFKATSARGSIPAASVLCKNLVQVLNPYRLCPPSSN